MPVRRSSKTEPAAEPKSDLAAVDTSLPAVAPKSGKKELLDANQALHERYKSQTPDEPQVKIEAEKRRQQAVVATAGGHTVEGVIQDIGALKLELTGVLNRLAEQLVARTETLKQLEDAIAIESKRLANLHDIEIAADSLSLLLQRQSEAEAEFEQRIAEKRSEVESALSNAREQTEAWIAAQREQFEAEQAARRAEWARAQEVHEQEAVAEAVSKVQHIAVQAIEGAAGRKALNAVNEIAIEQARHIRQP